MTTQPRNKWSTYQSNPAMPIQKTDLSFFGNRHPELKISQQLIAAILFCNQHIVSKIINNKPVNIEFHDYDITTIKRAIGTDAEKLMQYPLRFALMLSLKLSPIQEVQQQNPGQTNIHGIIAFLTSIYNQLSSYLHKQFKLDMNLTEDIRYFAHHLQNQDPNNGLAFPQASSTVSALYLGLSVLADNPAYEKLVTETREILTNLESGKTISYCLEDIAQQTTTFSPAA